MKDKRLALIIGISNYQFASKLRNPVNDVISMESVLSKLGFHIITLKNPTMKEMKLAIKQWTGIPVSVCIGIQQDQQLPKYI